MIAILLFSLFALNAFTRLIKKHGLEQQWRLCISGYGMNGNALECDRDEQLGTGAICDRDEQLGTGAICVMNCYKLYRGRCKC